jgi:hypothetical protein
MGGQEWGMFGVYVYAQHGINIYPEHTPECNGVHPSVGGGCAETCH